MGSHNRPSEETSKKGRKDVGKSEGDSSFLQYYPVKIDVYLLAFQRGVITPSSMFKNCTEI